VLPRPLNQHRYRAAGDERFAHTAENPAAGSRSTVRRHHNEFRPSCARFVGNTLRRVTVGDERFTGEPPLAETGGDPFQIVCGFLKRAGLALAWGHANQGVRKGGA
jgi:hypothetical protein